MKQLKDYIHFYIGCEVVRFNGRIGLHITGILVGVTTGYLLVKGGYATARVEFDEDTRLVLRRMESMTEEQAQQLDVAMWEDDGPMATGLLDRDGILKQFEWATDSDYRICFGTYIKAANWLRKNKFDCDDLIDAGLAIDAATLEGGQQP